MMSGVGWQGDRDYRRRGARNFFLVTWLLYSIALFSPISRFTNFFFALPLFVPLFLPSLSLSFHFMSVVLRSASGSLNDITFKNRLSVDRSSIISLASSKAGPAKKSEMILKAPTQDTTTNIVVAKPDGQLCSKRKPLKDITLKVCLQLSQSVASCQSSVRDFTTNIFVGGDDV